jgi:hypothetical protein
MMHHPVTVFLPKSKTTIQTPKVLAKLVFELNYKGLTTLRTEIDASNNLALIELQRFEDFRRCLHRWQLCENDANRAMWQFFRDNVSIELNMQDGSQRQTETKTAIHPFTPILRFDLSKVYEFAALFYKANFSLQGK